MWPCCMWPVIVCSDNVTASLIETLTMFYSAADWESVWSVLYCCQAVHVWGTVQFPIFEFYCLMLAEVLQEESNGEAMAAY